MCNGNSGVNHRESDRSTEVAECRRRQSSENPAVISVCLCVCCVCVHAELTLNTELLAGSKSVWGSGTESAPVHVFLDICVCRWPGSHFTEMLPKARSANCARTRGAHKHQHVSLFAFFKGILIQIQQTPLYVERSVGGRRLVTLNTNIIVPLMVSLE